MSLWPASGQTVKRPGALSGSKLHTLQLGRKKPKLRTNSESGHKLKRTNQPTRKQEVQHQRLCYKAQADVKD